MPSNRVMDFQVLYRIANAVSSALVTEEVLQAIVKSVAQSLGVKGCALLLRAPGDGKELIHVAGYGLSESYLRKGPVTMDPITDEVLKGDPVLILDARYDRRVEYPEEAWKEGIASMLSIPLIYVGRVMGVLRLYTAEQRFFDQEEIDFLKAVANLSATALNRAKEHENRVASLNEAVNACYIELGKLEEGRKHLLRFLAMVGHDLKSPIAAVQNYLSVLLAGIAGPLTERQKHILERSRVRMQDLVALINDLVDISRLEMGQIPLELAQVAPGKAIEAALEVVRSVAQERGVGLRTDIPDPMPEVVTDGRRLQQVLVNLLINAINYTPQSGTVTARVRDEQGQVRFEVLDSGVGIPAQDLPRVFEEFFRGSNVEPKGTGLGLSISKRIVEYLEGKIWVESPCLEMGLGSKFSFTLPEERLQEGVSGGTELPPKGNLA